MIQWHRRTAHVYMQGGNDVTDLDIAMFLGRGSVERQWQRQLVDFYYRNRLLCKNGANGGHDPVIFSHIRKAVTATNPY